MNSTPGALLAQVADEPSGDVARRRPAGGGRRAAAVPRAPCRISCSFLRAHALQLAQPPARWPPAEIVERADAQLRVEQRHRLRSDALQAQQVEDRRRELLQQLLVDSRRSPVSASSRIFAARSLPMPGQLAQLRLVEARDRLRPHAATMSAALRYARILNGFSPLISSRSAISPRTLRDREVVERHVIHASQRHVDRSSRCGSRAARAPPAASASRTAGRCSGGPKQNRQPPPPAPQTLAAVAPAAIAPRDQVVDRRRA